MKSYMGTSKRIAERISALFSGSAIMRFSKKCYKAMLSGFFGSLFTKYSPLEKAFEQSSLGNKSIFPKCAWNESFLGKIRRRAIVSYENSRIAEFVSKTESWLMSCHLKMYGFFFMYFGLCTLLMNLVKRFALTSNMSSETGWYVGALLLTVSLPLLLSRKNLASAIDESPLFSRIIYGILDFSRSELIKRNRESSFGGKRYLAAAIAGSLLGIMSFKYSPLIMLLFAAVLLCCSIIYKKPEIGMIIVIFVAPFLSIFGSPSILLALLILFTLLCTVSKAFLGRLIIKFEISDLFIALFLFVTFFGGVFSFGAGDSFKEASLYVCLLFGYFLFVTLVNSRKWLRYCTIALVASGFGTALLGMWQKLIGNLELETMDEELFADLGGRITSTFENSNMLGVFLIMVFPFALMYLLKAQKVLSKLLCLGVCGVIGICLIFTWSRGAWLGLILACFIFVILYNHYLLPVLAPCLLLGITVFGEKLGGNGFFSNLVTRFSSIITMSDSSSVYRLGIWRGASRIINEYWLTGIGIGPQAFRSVYIQNAESGIENAVHSHNLFLQIMIETGIIGLLLFVSVVIICIKSGLESVRYTEKQTQFEKAVAVASISALLAALLQGMTDHIWFNYRIYFLFWIVIAIINSSSRIARRHGARPESSEHKNPES